MYEANLRICTVPVLLLQVHRIFSCAPGKVHEKINGHRSSLSELLDASDVCSAVRNGLASVRCRKQSIKWLQGIVSFFKRQAAMCSVKAVLAVGVLAYASFDPHRLLGDFSKKVATPIPLSAGIIKALAYYCRWNQLENLEFQYIFSNRNHPGLELTEAWPSVTALSPLSPPAQTAQAVLSCWWSKTLCCSLDFGCRCGTDDMAHLSADGNIKPASTHPLPVLHMPFLSSRVYFKRYNSLASCPCF